MRVLCKASGAEDLRHVDSARIRSEARQQRGDVSHVSAIRSITSPLSWRGATRRSCGSETQAGTSVRRGATRWLQAPLQVCMRVLFGVLVRPPLPPRGQGVNFHGRSGALPAPWQVPQCGASRHCPCVAARARRVLLRRCAARSMLSGSPASSSRLSGASTSSRHRLSGSPASNRHRLSGAPASSRYPQCGASRHCSHVAARARRVFLRRGAVRGLLSSSPASSLRLGGAPASSRYPQCGASRHCSCGAARVRGECLRRGAARSWLSGAPRVSSCPCAGLPAALSAARPAALWGAALPAVLDQRGAARPLLAPMRRLPWGLRLTRLPAKRRRIFRPRLVRQVGLAERL